jgi:hypothetical protein
VDQQNGCQHKSILHTRSIIYYVVASCCTTLIRKCYWFNCLICNTSFSLKACPHHITLYLLSGMVIIRCLMSLFDGKCCSMTHHYVIHLCIGRTTY